MNFVYMDILSKSTILLVEDENELRKSFKKVLSLWVKDVHEASNGEEAILVYQKYFPDIIITDIKMPKINGLDFIQTIRDTNSDIPIIVTSAYTDKDFLLKSIKLSLIEYLVKPIQEHELERVLFNCAKKILEKSPIIVQIEPFGSYDYQNKCFIDKQKNSIDLTAKEAELIEFLLKNRGDLLSKNIIESHLYVYEEAPPSALKNLVFKLRKKLNCDVIKGVGKLGYKID